MGYFVAIYFGKLLIWDKVLGLGTTRRPAGLCFGHREPGVELLFRQARF
jgi:hypothetical protein